MTKKKIRGLIACIKGFVLVYSLGGSAGQANIPLGQTNIELMGNIVSESCSIVNENSNLYVDLGSWSTRILQETSGRTSKIPFTLQLSDCPLSETLGIYLVGQAGGTSHLFELSKESTATNVGVEILNKDGDPISSLTNTMITTDTNGNATLHYYARYAVIAAGAPITAGSANASASLIIVYD